MQTVEAGIRELKSQLSAYLRQVKAGERIVITERGRPIGRLVPIAQTVEEQLEPEPGRLDCLEWAETGAAAAAGAGARRAHGSRPRPGGSGVILYLDTSALVKRYIRALSAQTPAPGLAFVFLVVLLMGACTPQGTGAPTPRPAATATPTPKDSPTPGPTPSPTATEKPSATPTPKVSPTVDASRTPTVEQQRATLQKRVDDWISGKTKLDQSELARLLNPHKVEYAPLGTTIAVDYSTENFTQYQGVLLGIIQIDGQHVAMIGFESKDGKRYSLAFNIGPNDGLLVEAIQRPKFTLGFVEGEVHKRIPPAEFARRLAGLDGKPIYFMSPVADQTKYPSASEEVTKQIFPTIPVARATYDFVNQATNGKLGSPPALIVPFFNKTPKSVSVESLPKMTFALQTGNWVTSP